MVLKVVAQAGVTAQERDSNFFESDQATYSLYLHVGLSVVPHPEDLSSSGLYGNINLIGGISEDTTNTSSVQTDITTVGYYIDGVYVGNGTVTKGGFHPPAQFFNSSLSLDSSKYIDGQHNFNIIATNAEGNSGYSVNKTFWIENHPGTGPTPTIRFVSTTSSYPRDTNIYHYLNVDLVAGYEILRVEFCDTQGNLVATGKPLYGVTRPDGTNQILMWQTQIPTTQPSGTYSVYAKVYYAGDLVGYSPAITYTY